MVMTFLDMVISVQIVSLRFVSRSLSFLIIIRFLANSINPPHFCSYHYDALFHSPLCEIEQRGS